MTTTIRASCPYELLHPEAKKPVHLSVHERIDLTAAASARLEFRVTPAHKALIERAAEITGEPVSSFARDAAEERADRILREHDATTVVPAGFFDDLLAALDNPAVPNPALITAAERMRETVTRA